MNLYTYSSADNRDAALIDRLFQARIYLKNRISTEPFFIYYNHRKGMFGQ